MFAVDANPRGCAAKRRDERGFSGGQPSPLLPCGAYGHPESETMDIKELTDRINQFVTDKGWYAADSIFPQTPRNIAISVAVEAAELLEHFQFSETPKDLEELAGELADVANYLFQLAYLMNIDLERAILDKLQRNYGRTWE